MKETIEEIIDNITDSIYDHIFYDTSLEIETLIHNTISDNSKIYNCFYNFNYFMN
ncbi:MAG: hypothetical protein ACOCZ5_01385 [bacterium]